MVEERKIQEAAITTSTKLKQALDAEKTDRKKYEQEATQLKVSNCVFFFFYSLRGQLKC